MTEVQKKKIIEMRRRGCSVAEIAAEISASPNTVKTYCFRHRAEWEATAEPTVKPGFCQNCGQRIVQEAKQKPKKYCCVRCRELWWNKNRLVSRATQHTRCAYCGGEFEKRRNSGQRFCCHAHYILDRFGEVKADGKS